MLLSGTYDFKTLYEVDRHRKKKFKKLLELHKEVFAKGIFKIDKPCYTQDFRPKLRKKRPSIKTVKESRGN